MPQISKTAVDTNLRTIIFDDIFSDDTHEQEYIKINDRQWGVILPDLNGVERYVRIGAIVAEERENMTARELMQSEIDKYNEAQEKKAQKAAEKEEKIKRDAAKRAERVKKKEEEVE